MDLMHVHFVRYTGKRWGRAQLLAYRDKLNVNDALAVLSQNPEMGHQSAELELPGTHRLYFAGSHVIVYG